MKIESVWDYPRPPRMEPTPRRIRVVHEGVVIVDTVRALRVLETSHPPVYYAPPEDVLVERMRRSSTRPSCCEYKGFASYWNLLGTLGTAWDAAWSYDRPTPRYAALAGHIAFYASKVEECWVDEERVLPQDGVFYGGWITRDIVGPFEGSVGTRR